MAIPRLASRAAMMARLLPSCTGVGWHRHPGATIVGRMGELDGRVALVTGGGRGIGRGISELLAAEGAAVAVNYRRDEDSARATVDAITAAGGTARAYQASVDDAEVGLTRTFEWSGPGLGSHWKQIDRRSSFVGSFTIRR